MRLMAFRHVPSSKRLNRQQILEQVEDAESQDQTLFEERHFTIHELLKMWHFSAEFVRS